MKRINRWYIFSMKTELSYLAFLNSFPSIPFYFVLIARLRRGDCSPSGQGFREQLKRYRVTRYHTLLCSDEHKNPLSGGLRENRFQPQHKAERFVLSFGCKAEASETTFQEPKPPNVAIPTTPLPFPAEAIQPIFSYRRNQCTTIGLDSRRSAGTDRQAAE